MSCGSSRSDSSGKPDSLDKSGSSGSFGSSCVSLSGGSGRSCVVQVDQGGQVLLVVLIAHR